jgi:TonB family protein
VLFLESQAIASVLLLLAAIVVCAVLRRSPAAQRYFIWSLAFLSLLAIPLLALLMSPLVPAAQPSTPSPLVVVTEGEPQAVSRNIALSISWQTFAGGLWAAGAAILLLRIASGMAICANRRSRSLPFPSAEPVARRVAAEARIASVDIKITSSITVPETFGLRRPTVLLPDAAREWTEERLRVVLLHEFIHIQRRDWAMYMIARVTSSLFWFNPLCWYALARLREERELACDDQVLHCGIRQSDYAHELIEIAKNLNGRAGAFAIAMARPSNMEVRIRAILNTEINRRRLTLKDKYLVLIPAVLVIAAASLVTAPAQTGIASISGIVRDPSGAVVPAAVVVIAHGKGQETVRTNETGRFEFSGIPDGTYSLKVLKPGFREFARPDIRASAASPSRVDVTLDLGRISETVQVVARGQARAQVSADTGPQRIRVGGHMQPARLISRVEPQYPSHLVARGEEGTVLLEAVIGTNGQVLNAQVRSSQVDAELIKAAIDAVKQWRYEPTLLNGAPVEVVNAITVEFRLSQ